MTTLALLLQVALLSPPDLLATTGDPCPEGAREAEVVHPYPAAPSGLGAMGYVPVHPEMPWPLVIPATWCLVGTDDGRVDAHRPKGGGRLAAGPLEAGKPHGEWRWWHPGGQKAAAGRFEAGIPAGKWTWWHPSGALAATGAWKEGLKHGRWRYHDDQGRLIADYRLEEGTGTFTRRHPAGPVAARGELRGGKRHGVWRSWGPDCRATSICRWEAGRRHGLCRRYGPEGEPKPAICYERGRPLWTGAAGRSCLGAEPPEGAGKPAAPDPACLKTCPAD